MSTREDPDPATIIFGMVGVTSLVIQLVDLYARADCRDSIGLVKRARFDTLTRLQSSARQVSIAINDLLMAASYGSQDVDAELFDAPIGVSTGGLWLDQLTKPTFDETWQSSTQLFRHFRVGSIIQLPKILTSPRNSE